jgi:hypothetical protein
LRLTFSDGTISDSRWKCFTTSYGPTEESVAAGCSATNLDPCKLEYTDEPDGWKLLDFDDSTWSSATEFTDEEAGKSNSFYYDSM